MTETKERLVIVSLDAVGKKDMEYMLSLPNFSKIVNNGAFCDSVQSVYPSLTYPAHASILTGKVPNNHRVVNNSLLQPNRDRADWMYGYKYINGETLVDLAKKNGYSVAALLWPVLGKAPVDWNVPEVMVTRKLQNQVISCLRNGTVGYLLKLNKLYGKMRHGINQPDLDDFVMASTKYTIDNYDPDMLLIHFTDVDTNRHDFGADHEEIKKALKRHDDRLGLLLEWLSEKRPMDDTLFVVLGDHCQRDADTIVYPNRFLADKGLITIKNNRVKDYKVICKCCDASAYLYLNKKYYYDESVIEEVTDVINEMYNTENLGIERVFTGEEAMEMGADGDCIAMLEGKKGYYFLDNFEILTEKVNETKNHKMLGVHGFLPEDEENKTFFAIMGKKVTPGSKIGDMHLWDEGPTIAKLMGWNMRNTDGEALL